MRKRENYTLSNEGIDALVTRLSDCAAGYVKARKELLRITLALEESLLKYQEHFGAEREVSLQLDLRRRRMRFRVSVSGESRNPFAEDEEYSEILDRLSGGQGLTLQWEYKDGQNLLGFTFKKERKLSFLAQMLISVALALGASFLCALLPDAVSELIAVDIVQPVYETFIGLISFISGPLVLLSVTWGVFSIGDVSELSRIGKRMILRFLLMMLFLGVITLAVTLLFYGVTMDSGSGFDGRELYAMILDIVPDNLLAPILNGNTLQIIFIAVIIGIAMLILADKTTVAAQFVEQTNYIVQFIMEFISKLIPAFVFMSVFELFMSGGASILIGSYKMLISLLVAAALNLLIYITILGVRRKVDPSLLLKKMFSTFAIAITTASSAAAFANNVETCEKRLGIDRRVVNIGVPLGQTIFMPATTIIFFCIATYLAEYYGVEISSSWMVSLLLVSIILAIAAPPVPGGALACYTLIVAQTGLPADAIAMFCALGVIPDFIATATNLSLLQMELVELASSLNMLDSDVLHAPMTREN